MKIFFTISADHFSEIKNNSYTLSCNNVINIGTSMDRCIDAWKSACLSESAYDVVFMCSGEIDDSDVCAYIYAVVEGLNNCYEADVSLSNEFYRYDRRVKQ